MSRILFVTSSYPATPQEGVCGFVDDLARELAGRHGHEVRVIAPPGDFSGFEPVEVRPVIHPWPLARRLTAGADLGAAIRESWSGRAEGVSLTAALAQATQRNRSWADVTISHWLAPSSLAVALSSTRPHIAVAHGGDVHLLGRVPGGRRLARFIARRTDRIVAVSPELSRRLIALAPGAADSTDVIPMGANLGAEPEPAEVLAYRSAHSAGGSVVALFLGRLQPIKGADVLLEAAARVSGLDLWIAGDGPESARLIELARAARLRVSFLGRIDRRERRIALAACDLVAIPSRIEPDGRMEGTPVVCAEAFAGGRPVIATRTGGLADAVTEGVNGMLVAPGDVEALATALRQFVSEPALRTKLTDGARAVAPSFEMSATADAFDSLVAGVTRSTGASADDR